jgi:hypothetical protein
MDVHICTSPTVTELWVQVPVKYNRRAVQVFNQVYSFAFWTFTLILLPAGPTAIQKRKHSFFKVAQHFTMPTQTSQK